MSIRRLNLETDLRKLAKGEKSTMSVPEVAAWALKIVKTTKRNDEVEWLEKLYCLESGNTK